MSIFGFILDIAVSFAIFGIVKSRGVEDKKWQDSHTELFAAETHSLFCNELAALQQNFIDGAETIELTAAAGLDRDPVLHRKIKGALKKYLHEVREIADLHHCSFGFTRRELNDAFPSPWPNWVAASSGNAV